MRWFPALLTVCAVWVGLLIGSSSGHASTCDRPTSSRPCRTVVASIATIREAHWAGNADYDYISVTCYYRQKSDNSIDDSICAGGGDFDRLPSDDPICFQQPDNGATRILDKDKDCYFRKNYGLNGVVDARQCGVVGDGQPQGVALPDGGTHPDDAKVLNGCMNLVSQLVTQNLQNSLSIVTTGGGVILDNTTDITVPGNITLTCGGRFTSGGNNDYRIFKSDGSRNLTNAIVIDPTGHGNPPVYYSIKSTGKNATYKDCTVVAGAGARDQITNKYPNPYSPSVFYPDCQFPYDGTNGNGTAAPCTETADGSQYRDETRASTAIQSAFSNPPKTTGIIPQGPAAGGIGIVAQSGINIQNVRVIGFGTCVTEQGPQPLVGNADCDGSTGISANTADVLRIDDTTVGADATTGEAAFKIDSIGWDNANSLYQATVELGTDSTKPGYNFTFQNGDIVWIAPKAGSAESTQGYWVVSNLGTCTAHSTCTFDLLGSKQSVPLDATVNGAGVPASVLTGVNPTDTNFRYAQIGQTVTDTDGTSHCSNGLTVTRVWPAKGLIFLSGPVICTGNAQHNFTFADNHNVVTAACELTDNPTPAASNVGCAQVDPNFRWGDGIYVENSGGVRAVNCQVYEHLVSWHMFDGTRSAFFSNCATGSDNDLPDRNLDALMAGDYPSGNIISVLIDGRHNDLTQPDQEADACETNWSNMVLGQHRQTNIVIQSNCNTPNRFANVSMGGGANGIDLEVDAGGASLVNAESGGPASVLKTDNAYLYTSVTLAKLGPYDANLSISNNYLPGGALIMANAAASASTLGCGNTFNAPTPYLCAPASFTQLPGGRLTLVQGQPVMTADTTSTVVYYAPYVSQQIPLYNTTAGVFGLSDSGASGLSLQLEPSVQIALQIYDIFGGTENGNGVQLCSGPAWSGAIAGASSRSVPVTEINGVWVNNAKMQCHFYPTGGSPSTQQCAVYECTYLGSIYVAVGGQVSQQFSPLAANGGGNPCLCLYNAYNRVALTSRSLDNTDYTYNVTAWRFMHGNPNNRVTAVDGLGQMQISAQLTDALANGLSGGRTAQIGVDFNVNSSVPAPVPTVQANATIAGSYSTVAPHTPFLGLWYAQAVEAAPSTGNAANFGGANLQQLSVQVAD